MILFSLLKLHVARAHPNIYKSIEVFKIQETSTFTKYKHALLNRPAPPRKKFDVGKDTELKIYKKILDEKSIDVDVYITDQFCNFCLTNVRLAKYWLTKIYKINQYLANQN
ncbi:hypothetical protein BpHYR1_008194 [Brachionus plicatilis]|uniref:Uncharacterized protein n=1 Tax=Brachionus plicatilis TaxID=10195 RepID=A0A3M7SSB4_BRAPC|nr:hypothetical protein BpHYR1_008194 [Brachionus plicatilis]